MALFYLSIFLTFAKRLARNLYTYILNGIINIRVLNKKVLVFIIRFNKKIKEKKMEKEREFKKVTPAPIILYWDKKVQGETKRYFHNGETGEESFNLEDIVESEKSYCMLKRLSKIEFGMGLTHDEKNELLMFNTFQVDTRGVEPGVKVEWKLVNYRRYCFGVSRNKEIVWTTDKSRGASLDSYKISYSFLSNYKHDVLGYNNVLQEYAGFSNSLKVFEDFFGPVYQMSANNQIRLQSTYDMFEMLKYKEPRPKNNKKQKQLDELVHLTKKLKINIKKLKNKNSFHEQYSVLERIDTDKPCCVLRTFTLVNKSLSDFKSTKNIFNEYKFDENYNRIIRENIKSRNMVIEGARIYFYDKDVICCKPNNIGEYILVPLFKNSTNWNNTLIDYNEAVTSGTRIEYLTSILKDFKVDKIGYVIWALIDVPVLEQLHKAGYKNIVKRCIYRYDSPAENFLHLMGDMNKHNSLYKKLGLNKHQLRVFDDYLSQVSKDEDIKENILNQLKRTVLNMVTFYPTISSCNIADIDNNTFDSIFNILNNHIEYQNKIPKKYKEKDKSSLIKNLEDINIDADDIDICYRYSYDRVVRILYNNYGIKALENMKDILSESTIGYMPNGLNQDLCRYCDTFVIQEYDDYLSMAEEIENGNRLPYKFNSCAQLKEMHDTLIIIHNKQNNKGDENKFEKQLSKLEKFQYENDTCMVVAPKSSVDLVVEGNDLRHCVKSYIKRVIDGNTNIMFIRKKDEPDKPFFTVEISNNGEIEQVHGFANCNADSDPLVSGFMKDWLKTKRVSPHGYNKVR